MADEEEVVETEPTEPTEPTVGGDSDDSSSDEPTPKSTSTITSHRLPMADTTAGYVDVAPHVMTDGSNVQHFKYIEKPGSRQLRVNSKGVTGSWTALKFPYKWVEEGIPSGTYPNQNEVKPVIGWLLPGQGNYWSDTFFYCKVQDIEFKELENGLCEATVNYTSDGFTGDLQIECSTEEITYKQPYRFKWEVDSTTDNNPYVENLDIKETILNYNVSKKLDYITLANTNHTTYDIDDFQYYITYAGAASNKINKSAWHGFAAETVLCTGLNFTPEFAVNGQLLFVNVSASFKVRLSGYSWNMMWKDPTTEKTSKGADLTWHQLPNQPFPEGVFYTTDPNKIGVKIFVGDVTLTAQADGSITVTENQNLDRGNFYKPYYMGVDSEDQPVHYYYYWTCDDFDIAVFTPHVVPPTTP